MYGKCVVNVCQIYGKRMANVWQMYVKCMSNVWQVYVQCMANVWQIVWQMCMKCMFLAFRCLYKVDLRKTKIKNKRWLYLLRTNLAEYPLQNQELLLCQYFWPKKINKLNKFPRISHSNSIISNSIILSNTNANPTHNLFVSAQKIAANKVAMSWSQWLTD